MPASFHRSKAGMQSHNLRIAVSAQEDKPIAKCQELVSSSAPYMSHPSHLKPRGSGREFHIRKDRIKSARYPHLRSLFDQPSILPMISSPSSHSARPAVPPAQKEVPPVPAPIAWSVSARAAADRGAARQWPCTRWRVCGIIVDGEKMAKN